MIRDAAELFRRERLQQDRESRMQAFENRQRRGRIGMLRVFQLRPFRFFVGFDPGIVLGQREPHARVGVEMTVGEMMDDLPCRPPAVTVRPVEPARRERREGGIQLLWQRGDLRDPGLAFLGRHVRIVRELPTG